MTEPQDTEPVRAEDALNAMFLTRTELAQALAVWRARAERAEAEAERCRVALRELSETPTVWTESTDGNMARARHTARAALSAAREELEGNKRQLAANYALYQHRTREAEARAERAEAALERVTAALHRVSAHFMDGYPIEGLEDHAAEAIRNVDEVLHGSAALASLGESTPEGGTDG